MNEVEKLVSVWNELSELKNTWGAISQEALRNRLIDISLKLPEGYSL